MPVEQYAALLDIIPDIEHVLGSKGIKVPRPQFDKKLDAEDDENSEAEDEGADEDENEDEDEKEDAKVSKKHKVTLDRSKIKKNHEATSDEESE